MSENKTCKQCGEKFKIEDEDLKLYDKISPIFKDKKYQIPTPTFCPDCRQLRRLSIRNERKLYSDQCDLCQKPIVSLYSPDKSFQVYCQECWWSDKWDATKYVKDFDPSRPFFEQFQELQISVPKLSIFNLNSTNSEYTNHSSNNKNCYMGLAFGDDEDCMYGHWLTHSKDCLDMLYCEHCEECYECSYCQNCNNTFFSQHCQNIRDSLICFECKSCENCIGCVQLQHKKYHILNRQVSKDEFEKTKNKILTSPKKFQEIAELFAKLKLTAPHRYSLQLNCHNSIGNDLYNCKNSYFCFNCRELEDCKYMYDLGSNKDSMDCYEHGWLVPSELNYEAHAGMAGYHLLFCNICADSRDLIYCDLCFNDSRNNFGCVGLRKKQYCIFNKQYTKEEYEKLVPKIIEKMKANSEWGEFFPTNISPFGYNETAAQEYFPLTKNEATKLGAKWQDNDYASKYEGSFYQPKNIKEYVDNDKERQELLSGVIKCEVSGKPFKILPNELAFYIEHGIPIPNKHYNIRHKERLALRNPRKLFHRECMCEESGHAHQGKCPNEFETTYSPEKKEKVYCEDCYQKSII